MKTDDYFGLCPNCKGVNQLVCLNVAQGNWMHCPDCKTCWCVGWNLLGSWRNETEDDWRRNAAILQDCEEVTPRHYLSTRLSWWWNKMKYRLSRYLPSRPAGDDLPF